MIEANLPAVTPSRNKTKRYTRKHLYSARRTELRETKAAVKVDVRIARSRARRDERRLSAFKGIPATSTLGLLGEEA